MSAAGARLPTYGLAGAVSLLLVTFIAAPIFFVLIESLRVRERLPLPELTEVTVEALDRLPAGARAAAVERWLDGATEAERVEAWSAAFRLAGVHPAWDPAAAFADQARAIKSARSFMDGAERARVEAAYPTALIALHKRVPLAFLLRAELDGAAFERLRTGVGVRLGLDHYRSLAEESFLKRAALNSLLLGIAACALTVPLAFLLAFAVNRGGVRRPGLVRLTVLTPLVAPPVMIAFATVMLFGRRGLVSKLLLEDTLGWTDAETENIYGFWGVVAAQALSFLPATFIILDNSLTRQDGNLQEAAAGLGATAAQILRHVTLPMSRPALLRATLLVLMLSLTDFGNPLVLGRGTPVLAAVIYDEITSFQNTPLASAICVSLILPLVLLYLLLERLGRSRRVEAGPPGTPPETPLPRAWRLVLGGLAGSVCILIVLVYATVAAGAVTRVWGVDWSFTLGYFTEQGVGVGLQGSGYGSSDRGLALVWDSLEIAVVAALLGGLLAILTAYVVERVRPPGADLIAFLALLPAVLPGIIFGVGYIIAFNQPLGFTSLALTGTPAILVLNILFGNMFVGVLAARTALQRLDPALDEAAEGLGAGLRRRLTGLVLPMLRHALILGMLYVFIDGMVTLSAVIFLVSGDHKLASVAIFNHAASGEFGYAGAKSVVILAITLVAMLLGRLYASRSPLAAAGFGAPGRLTAARAP